MRELVASIIKYTILAGFAGGVFHFALVAQKETQRLWHEERQLKIQIAELRKANDNRLQVLEALRSDPFYIERVLRERYGYRNSDEEEHVNIIRIARKPQTEKPKSGNSTTQRKSQTTSRTRQRR